ncbi:hypothetical protein C8263_15645 [Deinococcus arcticus]|uniref:DUF2268 domain-containing protein n=1 Tax=Deinococcus arcticus TaxID=2136176 RepID=A0A2T3W4S5_9DEIO|nr:hypothetical protein C8263_15645 [Deinococcus arcticus]
MARTALDRHAEALALDALDTVIHCSPWTIPEIGLVGSAPDGHSVLISVTPSNPNFAASWRTELPATLAHELHHAARWRSVGYGSTLLEALVSEGLAQHHERLERRETPIYAQPTTDLNRLWARASPALQGPYTHHAWFFGSEDQDLPRWGGYALGFELVGRFLHLHGGTAADHAHTPASAFEHSWSAGP